MSRPVHAVIHTAALLNNLEIARRHAPRAKVWAIVKADAYGHGIERVYSALKSADGFGLLDLSEAVRLRELGWTGPILLLEGFFRPADLAIIDRYRLIPMVHCEDQLRMLESAKLFCLRQIGLKMNSGMNRLGFTVSRFKAAWQR